jgi:hypothetical protein
LFDFDKINGYYTAGDLILSPNALYGMTAEGGINPLT